MLRDGGTLFATWLLLDDNSRAAVRAGRAALPFRIGPDGRRRDVSAVIDPAVPEDAIAFDRAWLEDLYARHGLTITAIHDGTWRGCGRTDLPGRRRRHEGNTYIMTSDLHREIETHFQGAEKAVCTHWIDGYVDRPRAGLVGRQRPGGARRRAAEGRPADAHPPRPRGRRGRAGGEVAGPGGLGPRARRQARDRPVAAGGASASGSTATRWSGCGAGSSRCRRPTSGC